jgi:hypothetical protein
MPRISLKIVGASGQGINSIGAIIAKGLKRSGYCVFGSWPISASRLRRPTKGGLVEEVADPGKAFDAAMALATKVAAQPPLSAP